MAVSEWMVLVVAGVFGALFGSFLNVVIHRLPERKSIVWPGSACPACNHDIRWYDNLPILSWLILRGKCRDCSAPISPRYILVELLTAVLTVFVVARYTGEPEGLRLGLLVVSLIVLYALIPVSFIDLALRIIPDRITKPGMVLAPILSVIVPELHALSPLTGALGLASRPRVEALLISLMGIAAGAGAIWFMGALGKLLFKKDSMGLGDVKLMGFLGGILGPVGVLMAILIGCVGGSVIGLLSYAFTRSHYIPFGPFLSLGAVTTLFFRPELVHFFTVTYPGLFG